MSEKYPSPEDIAAQAAQAFETQRGRPPTQAEVNEVASAGLRNQLDREAAMRQQGRRRGEVRDTPNDFLD